MKSLIYHSTKIVIINNWYIYIRLSYIYDGNLKYQLRRHLSGGTMLLVETCHALVVPGLSALGDY